MMTAGVVKGLPNAKTRVRMPRKKQKQVLLVRTFWCQDPEWDKVWQVAVVVTKDGAVELRRRWGPRTRRWEHEGCVNATRCRPSRRRCGR